MGLRSWWTGLSRAYQAAFVILLFDTLLLAGSLLHIAPLQAAWESITGFLPNLYDGIVMQLVAVIRDASPGSAVVSGVLADIITTFFSVITMHVVVAFGIGFLFDHTPRTKTWTFLTYFAIILVLFTTHFFLIVASYA